MLVILSKYKPTQYTPKRNVLTRVGEMKVLLSGVDHVTLLDNQHVDFLYREGGIGEDSERGLLHAMINHVRVSLS